jgi:hypothetical protein
LIGEQRTIVFKGLKGAASAFPAAAMHHEWTDFSIAADEFFDANAGFLTGGEYG